jgi:large subunit ribosomal protein L5|tara:strand:- start:18285 stop:18806 length:522 start_codon:yes stop_codon:yes gene_type:complete
MEEENKPKTENVMRKIKIEKVVLSVGGIGEELEKGFKLLKFISNKNPTKTKSKKRIPSLGVRPGLEIGAVVTLRKDLDQFLKRMLSTVDNQLKKKQISVNNFSFGIKEYIEIPGLEYQRDIGIKGFDITVVFKRTGRRVGLRKIKRGRVSSRQYVTKEEIIKFMEDNFQVEFN